MSVALDAITWIVDNLLTKKREKVAKRQAKWTQVAEYLDHLASTLDATVEDFRAGHVPYSHYSVLYDLGYSFETVLRQVYDGPDDYGAVHSYFDALYAALHLVERGDEMVLEAADIPTSAQGREVLRDLQAAAGRFRALAMTLRATA